MPRTSKSQWTILKLLKWTASYFKSHSIDSSRATAEILLAHTLQLKRIDLYVRYDQPLSGKELEFFKALIKRRIRREPVAYIVGTKEFWSMDLAVTPDVLIPRPETECLVEAALSILPERQGSFQHRILELGTGSGAISIALAHHRPGHLFFASDCSINAVELAKQNAKYHHLDKTILFFSGDWFVPLKKSVYPINIIVSNPPYIRTGEINHLQPEIYKYEPRIALDGGENGFRYIEHILHMAYRFLNKGGILLLETGYDQLHEVRRIIDAVGYYDQITCLKDYSGHDRVVRVRKI